ncbi:hypothetical protein SNE40_009113 [Patella caerulea]|uniref:non-specific serine/threonine protein kinase n=1 Tax=Patella caerulea TaxID=87958 RepID=A0AAN8JUD2_PATCE
MATEVTEFAEPQETSYILIRVLGKGAFGEAVLYRKTEDNSLVVWKEINLANCGDKERRDSQNEIDILSFLDHANIVSYYNHFIDGDTLFIEMEYANDGTLYEKIYNQTSLFPEKTVIWYLFQMTSALAYIHEYGIIHRDIKTLNIFLTKSGLLKLGDFGISKIMQSQSGMAETLVGTPYYMSPELMQGHKYNQKSDIWALGCVLYEMLTLRRTFEASNALKLARDIVLNQQSDINSMYSQEMQKLVTQLLQKEPANRPVCEEILKNSLFTKQGDLEKKVWELNSVARRARLTACSVSETTVPVVKAQMCEVYVWGGGKITPQKVEFFTKEKSPIQVECGESHFAVVTVEKEVFTWANSQGGSSMVGQLGHGDTAGYKIPKLVEGLSGIPVKQVSCGTDFTICVTDDGKLYGFGSDYYGCVGCDTSEEDDILSPIPINYFTSIPIEEISCGDSHCVALTKAGDVYTWGCGEFGRLGLGSEDDHTTPQKVAIPGKHFIKHVCAGSDGTFLIATNGRLLASGSNENNKLGFNSPTSGLRKRKKKVFDIPCKYMFSTVKPLSRQHIISVSPGTSHSACIDIYGCLYTFGCNKYGQLGLGDYKKRSTLNRVGGVLVSKKVEKVSCGDGFTVAATDDSQLYSWGNGENGKLGAIFKEQGKKTSTKCTSLPRPIFGSLHVVPYLSSHHWNTIIIAEKVLNQKTLKPRVSSPKYNLLNSPKAARVPFETVPEDSAFVEGSQPISPACSEDLPFTSDSSNATSPPNSRPSSGNKDESSIPPWLEAELQDAAFIRIPSKESNLLEIGNLSPVSEKDEKEIYGRTTADKDILIAQLRAKVDKLTEENKLLQETTEKQEELIKSLRLHP